MKKFNNLQLIGLIMFLLFFLTGQLLMAQDEITIDNFNHIILEEENKEFNYKTKIIYPEFINYYDKEIEKNFNETVRGLIDKEFAPFEEYMKDYDTAITEWESYFNIEYSLQGINNNIVSINFLKDMYCAGAAHGDSYFFSLNYDLNRDRSLTFSDLFTESSDYLKIISDYSIGDIMKQSLESGYPAEEEWVKRGAGPEDENFTCFNITSQGLIITFNVYQVGSYADGYKQVTIPYSVLKDVIKPDGPLSNVE